MRLCDSTKLSYSTFGLTNMAGSRSSVHGENHGEEDAPVTRADFQELRNMVRDLGRMFHERPPAGGDRVRHRQHPIDPLEEVGDENSVHAAVDGDLEDDNNSHGGHVAAARGRGAAAHGGQRGGQLRGRGHGPRGHYYDPHERVARGHGDDFDDYDGVPYRRAAEDGRRAERRDRDGRDDIARIKLHVPKFTGKEDPDAYFDWEEQCDQIFRIHNLADPKRVNLACVEFSGYALTWWNQLQENQLLLGRDHIDTWEEMKQAMRRRFVPSQYQRDLRNRLQRLSQGTRTVDEYYKEMELLLVRARIHEDEESKMARFLHGLNNEISDFVEMFPYNTLQDILEQAKRTERKVQRSGHGRISHNRTTTPWQRLQPSASHGGSQFQHTSHPTATRRTTASSASSPAPRNVDKRAPSAAGSTSNPTAVPSSRSRDIECWKCKGHGHISSECRNKRVLFVNEQGEWESESEHEDNGALGDHEDEEGEKSGCDIQADMGDCFVSRRVLSVNAAREEKGQRHNIFHTRGTIKDKVCRIIVDNGSCNNIASSDLVEKLGLKQRRHPSPYKMQWLNDCGTLRVSNIVTVQFSIGKYRDQVECDVVPMQACQLLLGRPWLYDRDVQISGRTNRLSFQYEGERISLLPLTPEEILMDDLKKKERVSEKHLSDIHQHSERENPKPNKTP